MSASPVLSVPCLPSCVSLSGGVRLSGLVCALSPFICLPSCVSLSGGVRLSGLVCALSPFICLPSCVSLSGGVRLSVCACVEVINVTAATCSSSAALRRCARRQAQKKHEANLNHAEKQDKHKNAEPPSTFRLSRRQVLEVWMHQPWKSAGHLSGSLLGSFQTTAVPDGR